MIFNCNVFHNLHIILLVLVGLISILVSVFLRYQLKVPSQGPLEEKKLLLIGIISAQENLFERNLVRNSWIKDINLNEVDYKFVIGETICPFHPLDRLSPYECNLWNVSTPDSKNKTLQLTSYEISGNKNPLFYGFTFLIKHDIILESIGIISDIVSSKPSHIFGVGLFDSVDGKKLASGSFIYNSYTAKKSVFLSKPTKRILLKAGFEGEIKLLYPQSEFVPYALCKTQSPHQLYRIFEVLTLNFSCEPYLEDSCSSVGFSFSVPGFTTLKKFVQERNARDLEWKAFSKKLKKDLEKESVNEKDIIFLPLVDTYKNITLKLERFWKWVSHQSHWRYIMKTDDDILIHIKRVQSELHMGNNSWDIWSCFREGWFVPRSGKWRYCLGNQTIYPPFPYGGGYIFKAESIPTEPLGEMGEDISIGIYLSKRNEMIKHKGSHCLWTCGFGNLLPCDAALFSPDLLFKKSILKFTN